MRATALHMLYQRVDGLLVGRKKRDLEDLSFPRSKITVLGGGSVQVFAAALPGLLDVGISIAFSIAGFGLIKKTSPCRYILESKAL